VSRTQVRHDFREVPLSEKGKQEDVYIIFLLQEKFGMVQLGIEHFRVRQH